MTEIIIFAIGFYIGGFSALLVVGLTLASRHARMRRPSLDMLRYDIEHSDL